MNKFFKKYKQHKEVLEDDDNDFEDRIEVKSLYKLNMIEKTRKSKDQKLQYLKKKCSNPNLFKFKFINNKK